MKDVQFFLINSYFIACARRRVLFNAISENTISEIRCENKS